MIQFNLLPDVKLNYIKTRQTKRMVTLIAIFATSVAVGIMVILFIAVNILQKQRLNSLNNQISTYSSQLQNTPNLNKILTIQNQLNNLTALHNQKPVASRLFDYLTKLTPNQATIAKLDIDFVANTITINGTAQNLTVVNQFADTLKFTTYNNGGTTNPKAFSNVVLTSFSVGSNGTQYELNTSFDPNIFNNSNNITLTVPNIISTRSVTDSPSNLFQPNSTNTSKAQ